MEADNMENVFIVLIVAVLIAFAVFLVTKLLGNYSDFDMSLGFKDWHLSIKGRNKGRRRRINA
jgi:hypothetical protein